MNFLKRTGMFIVTLIFIISLKENAMAASFNGSASSATANNGEEVKVVVSCNSDATIGSMALSISYDPAILQYVSGSDNTDANGTVTIYRDYVNQKSVSYTITFKAIAAGSSSIKVSEINTTIDIDGNDMTSSLSGGTVTVKAPVASSSNNYLTKLSVSQVLADNTATPITLSPAFSKDVLEYNLTIPSEVVKLAITAEKEDAKAKISIPQAFLKMDPGKNTTNIIVTAEDGTVRKYIIHTVKGEAATETTAAAETTAQPETTAEVILESRKLKINDTAFIITDLKEGIIVPEGFEIKQVEYAGENINGAVNLSGTMTLLYLVNEATSEGKYFIYNKEEKSLSPFITGLINQKSYIILPLGNEFIKKYENISKTKTIEIGNEKVTALSLNDNKNIYILRAMNWDGKTSYYYYDSDEKNMLKFFEESLLVDDKTIDAYENRIDKRNTIIFILGSVALVYIIYTGYVIYKKTMNKKRRIDSNHYFFEVTDVDTESSKVTGDTVKIEDLFPEEVEEDEMEENEVEENVDVTESTESTESTEDMEAEKVEEVSEVENAEMIEDIEITEETATEEVEENKKEEPLKEEEIDKAIDEILNSLYKS